MKWKFALVLSPVIALLFAPLLFSMEGKPDTSYADTLKVINCQADAGSTVLIPIWLVNSFPVAGFEFRIVFNDSILTPIGCSRGSRIDYFANFVPTSGENWYRIWGTASGLSEHNPPLSPGSDTLAFISFLVDSNAQKGSYPIKFEADPDHSPPIYNALTDTLYQMIYPVCVTGTLKVEKSGIEDYSFPELPRVFHLAQNYPNPFNPTTIINYQLSIINSPIYITLKIYNVAGQLVKTLVDKKQETGEYSVSWDGRDSFGERVSCGVYFYRLVAGDFVATKKMILLR